MYIDRVKLSDMDYILSWIKDIWGEHDYIPHVWRRWMKEGEFLAIYDNEKPIAIWHIKWLGDTAWFEGMRVKPEYQGRGLAKKANIYSLDLARQKGCRRAMLITMKDNLPAQKSLESIGFVRAAKYTILRVDDLSVLEPKKFNIGLSWNQLTSKYYRLADNNYIMAWRRSPWIFLPVYRDAYNRIYRNDRIYVDDGVAITGPTIQLGGENYIYVRYLDALSIDGYLDILGALKEVSDKKGISKLYGYIPSDPELIEMVKGVHEINEEKTFYVYKYDL